MAQVLMIGARARIANPALAPLAFLIGKWRTTGTHPETKGQTLTGRTSFDLHEGGAFLVMRSQVDDPRFPDGLAIIGSDDVAGTFSMTYFDERGISRLYDVTVEDRRVTWHRSDREFAQSVTIAGDANGCILISKGRLSQNGGAWTDDLSQDFERETE